MKKKINVVEVEVLMYNSDTGEVYPKKFLFKKMRSKKQDEAIAFDKVREMSNDPIKLVSYNPTTKIFEIDDNLFLGLATEITVNNKDDGYTNDSVDQEQEGK